ncbi:MAG: hypothetical protein Q8P08_01480, partial [bacterium]|nr:hypothetical protein [bacterium]
MTPQTAQWYLEIVKAYLEDPQKAQDKYQLSPSLLKDVFKDALGTDDFNRVKNLLEGILGGKALGQNVPNPDLLKYWHEEYERVQIQKRKITEDVIREIRNNIKQRQAMALQIHQLMETERKKPEVQEIAEKPEYVQQSFEDLSFELKDRIPSIIHQWAAAKITPTTEEYTDTIFNFALEISKRRELLGFNRERLASISQNLAEGTYQTASEVIGSYSPTAPETASEQEKAFPEQNLPSEFQKGTGFRFGGYTPGETESKREPDKKISSGVAITEKPQARAPISVLERQLEEKEESLQMAETKKLSATDELR